MIFKITSGWGTPCSKNTIFLYTDNWDDFCFKTTFHAIYCDKKGMNHELGTIKIGKAGMLDGGRVSDYLDSQFLMVFFLYGKLLRHISE